MLFHINAKKEPIISDVLFIRAVITGQSHAVEANTVTLFTGGWMEGGSLLLD